MPVAPATTVWRPRVRGRCNWLGLWAHTKRGVLAFLANTLSELIGPLVTAAMFLAVFVLAMEEGHGPGSRQALVDFVGPGIVGFMMAHQAFQHAAALLVMDKHERTIQDLLMAPLTAFEIMAGYVMAAVVTALMVGALILAMMVLLADISVARPLALAGFALLGALLFALAGAIVGLWADTWERYTAAESFLILPLGMLSGAFFRVDALAGPWRWVVAANPFHYVIEGLRWSAVGGAQGTPILGVAVSLALILVFGALTLRLFSVGYHLKP